MEESNGEVTMDVEEEGGGEVSMEVLEEGSVWSMTVYWVADMSISWTANMSISWTADMIISMDGGAGDVEMHDHNSVDGGIVKEEEEAAAKEQPPPVLNDHNTLLTWHKRNLRNLLYHFRYYRQMAPGLWICPTKTPSTSQLSKKRRSPLSKNSRRP